MLQDTYVPVKTERVSAQEYLIISVQQKNNIAKAKFIAPSIGDRTFGSFEIEYQSPVLKKSDFTGFLNYA